MPKNPHFDTVLHWLKRHPGIFSAHEEGDDLLLRENFSQKTFKLKGSELSRLEEKTNSAKPTETYLVLFHENGRQLAIAQQGFVFAPDFTNTESLPLPSQVYCMQDFQLLFNRLRHIASEAERGREALDLLMVLIAILDGAKAAGLEVSAETQEIETILSALEKGETLPSPH